MHSITVNAFHSKHIASKSFCVHTYTAHLQHSAIDTSKRRQEHRKESGIANSVHHLHNQEHGIVEVVVPISETEERC